MLAYTDLTRGTALFGPTGAGIGHALGAGCAWLWSCGGAGRPVVRRYLWRGLRSDNDRGDTTIAMRSSRTWSAPVAIRTLPDLCLGPAGLFRQSRCIGQLVMTRPSPGTRAPCRRVMRAAGQRATAAR